LLEVRGIDKYVTDNVVLLIQQANLIETLKKAKRKRGNDITQVYIPVWMDNVLRRDEPL